MSRLSMGAMAREPKSAGLSTESARLLFERTDNFVCTLDLEGRFTSINPAGEALTGYAAHELIGKFATELIPPDARGEAARQFARRLRGEASGSPSPSILLRRDGARIPISVSSIVVEA